MAKSPPSNPAPPKSADSPWLSFLLIGVCGVLLGATGTYFVLLPKLAREPAPATVAAGEAEVDPLSHLPSPELTAGQSPAQADRTLGNFYYDHQNWPEAIRSYQSAIKQGFDDADIRTDLGNAYRFSGRPDDALAQYRVAQQMNPGHEFSLFNQGGVYLDDLRQPQKAREVWTEYLRRFPQGRNVAAAQQFLAQANAASAGTAAGQPGNHPAAAAAPSDADVDRLLRLVPPAKPAPGKP